MSNKREKLIDITYIYPENVKIVISDSVIVAKLMHVYSFPLMKDFNCANCDFN